MRSFRLVALLLALGGLVLGCSIPRHSVMERQSWDEWYARHASRVEWVGYQGSDARFHHFVAREKGFMGEAHVFVIGKDELVIEDERPWSSYWTGPQYHYLVDPNRNYAPIR